MALGNTPQAKRHGREIVVGGFRTSQDAQLAGKRALEDFLNGLAMERMSRLSS